MLAVIDLENEMHTPGPWKATKDPHGHASDYCIGMQTDKARIDRVATCSACDAALIAAAPELLAALVELRDWYTEHTGLPAVAANAAIAKAVQPNVAGNRIDPACRGNSG